MDTRPQKRAARIKAAQQSYLEGKVAGENFTHLQDDRQLLGACLIRPALSRCVPGIVSNQFSPFGIQVINLTQSGAGIEAVTESLTASGMENAEAIVADAIKSVRGNPTKTFWHVIRRLCDEVLP